jgi:hypothetical protein
MRVKVTDGKPKRVKMDYANTMCVCVVNGKARVVKATATKEDMLAELQKMPLKDQQRAFVGIVMPVVLKMETKITFGRPGSQPRTTQVMASDDPPAQPATEPEQTPPEA